MKLIELRYWQIVNLPHIVGWVLEETKVEYYFIGPFETWVLKILKEKFDKEIYNSTETLVKFRF